MTTFLSKPPDTATEGERLFSNRLEQAFENEDHILAYFEPEIGGKRPDFLLLSPNFGIMVVEIKDYLEEHLNTISKFDEMRSDKKVENVSFLVITSLNATCIRFGTLSDITLAALLYFEILLNTTMQ